MFVYRCPGCGKWHVTAKEPEPGNTGQCPSCGRPIEVPETSQQPAPVHASMTPSPDSEKVKKSARSRSARLEAAVTARRPPRAERPAPSKESETPRDKITTQPAEETPAVTQSPPRKESRPFKEKISPRKGNKPSWTGRAVLAGLLVAVLAAAGFGAFQLFKKKEAPGSDTRTAGKSPPESKKPSSDDKKADTRLPEKKTPDPSDEKAPVFKSTSDKVVRISAARLAAEWKADAAATNRKYRGTLLEVSGRFAKMEKVESVRPPARPHAVLAAEGRPIRCDLLGSPTPEERWKGLSAHTPVTVRGAFSADGFLHGCELLGSTPPADALYKGKEIELVGFVEAILQDDFPTIKLERDTIDSIEAVCRFRKTDRELVRKTRLGDEVTVRGTCSGRHPSANTFQVRLENCQLVHTSEPAPPAMRFDAAAFLCEYEEDLTAALRPVPGKEERVEQTLTIAELTKELNADGQAFEKKYRNKVVAVLGRLQKKTPEQALLVLESGDTTSTFAVRCFFAGHSFRELDDRQVYRIRGLYFVESDGKSLRLDNCEAFDPKAPKDRRRITVDYLPHAPGQARTYDVAVSTSLGDGATVVRQIFRQREDGVTETTTTHVGALKGIRLLDPAEGGKWMRQRGVRRVKDLKGPTYARRIAEGFIEISERPSARQGEAEIVWEPILKLGARTGATWSWAHGQVKHQYTLVRFDRHRGRSSAIVNEVLTLSGSDPVEVRHVYVEGIGEVERQESLRIDSRQTKVLREKRLVEE
jgi:hypothetical protein